MKRAILGFISLPLFLCSTAKADFSAELLLGRNSQEVTIDSIDIIDEMSGSGSNSIDFGEGITLGLRFAYIFNKYVAVELSYNNYGEVDTTYAERRDIFNDKINTNSVNLSVKGSFEILQDLSINARLGLAKWDISIESTDSSESGKVDKYSENGQNLFYSVGVQYNLSNNLFVGLEYYILDIEWENRQSFSDAEFFSDFKYSINSVNLSTGYIF